MNFARYYERSVWRYIFTYVIFWRCFTTMYIRRLLSTITHATGLRLMSEKHEKYGELSNKAAAFHSAPRLQETVDSAAVASITASWPITKVHVLSKTAKYYKIKNVSWIIYTIHYSYCGPVILLLAMPSGQIINWEFFIFFLILKLSTRIE